MKTPFTKYCNCFVFLLCFSVVTLHAYPPEFDSLVARKVVNSLDIEKFKYNILELSDMGDRLYGSASNKIGQEWIQATLEEIGYEATIQSSYKNVMCTKAGSISPDSCYIIGAHYDGRSGGGAADDDASGTSLIIEAARVFFDPNLKTHYSIRFILFNCEETGISGSNAYARDRVNMQGKEDPVGSGSYPEPLWLGMVAHDMVLYDHGVPWQQNQIEDADLDVEYKSGTTCAQQSLALANELVDGCETYAADYPAEVGSKMTLTDSEPFKNRIAAVSIRENQRADEIGNNSNPHYHKVTDVYKNYSDLDFLLGFNAIQMTVGTICRLAGVYDSSITAVSQKTGKDLLKNPSLSSDVTGIRIFTVQGKKVFENQGTYTWKQYMQSMGSKGMLPKGLYIIQLTGDSENGIGRFLRVID